jgi:hypothetical protein
MSRPVTFSADTEVDDGALSVDPSSGASVAEITREDLPVVPGPENLSGRGPEGCDAVACETQTEDQDHWDDPSSWNGVVPLEEEGDDDVQVLAAATVPVPVPERQGLPSFAQSEFYTVDMIYSFFFSLRFLMLTCCV